MRYFLIAIFSVLLAGCVSREVVSLSIVTDEEQQVTTQSMVESIDAELKVTTKPDEIQKLEELRERFLYLQRANSALRRALTTGMKPEELSKIVQERAQKQGDKP